MVKSSPKRRILIAIAIVALIIGLVFLSRWLYIKHYESTVAERRKIPFKQRNQIMTELLSIVYGSAKAIGAKPFLLYGTLLGQVRQNDFICYDFDIDLGILSEEYESLFTQLKTDVAKFSEYHIKEKKFIGYRCVIVIHTKSNINVDISEFISNGKTFARNVPKLYSKYVLNESQADYPIEWILPLKEVSFKSQIAYTPNMPDKLLQTYYGSKYMIADHTCNAACDECVKN